MSTKGVLYIFTQVDLTHNVLFVNSESKCDAYSYMHQCIDFYWDNTVDPASPMYRS